jgi:signal transduction histidine kinase
MLTIATVLASYNILSYRTPDLKLLVGSGLHHVGMMVILSSVALLAFVAAIQLYISLPASINVWLWLTILAAFLASAYRPLIRGSNQVLTKIIFGRSRHDEKQMIKRYSQSISSTLDLQRLSDVTVDLMTQTLEIERSVVFVNERERTGSVAVRPYAAMGINELTLRRFTGESPFIKYFLEKGTILSQYDIDIHPDFSSMAQAEREWLADLGIELYVPVLREQELLAVLAFGPHLQGTTYNREEQELMMMLADQAGMAFEGALLFQQLATVNEEVGMLTDRLSVLDQSKADFLSIASHELRTPLTQIHTYSQLLLEFTGEDLKDEKYVQTVFEGIARGSERLKQVVDMMLDVSAADLGKMHLFSGPVVLNQVYDQALQPFVSILGERRIKLSQTGLSDLPMIEADGTRLVQVLENLIGNAIKYTPDGGEVLVRGRRIIDGDAGPAVEIAVIDRGIGIDREYHQIIFEKFFRVDDSKNHSTSKTKFKGAGPGLGLTLVKAIVEAHQGRVWVSSPGYDEKTYPGSTFCFTIPLPAARIEETKMTPTKTEVTVQSQTA